MKAKVILNPYANRWISQKKWPEAEAALNKEGISYDLAISEKPRQIIDLTREAVEQGYSPIIAAGGDGTIGEVVNGMAKASNSKEEVFGPLGILPLGSANDLVDNLGLPKDLGDAVKVIAAGQTKKMDVGNVNGFYFANNSAIGLEPYITLKQEKIHNIKGILRYLIAAVQGIWDNPQWNAEIEWDTGKYSGPILLVSVGNSPRTGGVFFMAPHADPFDGKLTFVHGYRKTRGQIFKLLPKTMKPDEGSFVEMEGIEEMDATWVKIKVDKPTPAHTDGEIFSTELTEFEYRIFPKKLEIILP
ncbi:diacylglycerol/lipid kinase family protein [Chloroflexota bacterium]